MSTSAAGAAATIEQYLTQLNHCIATKNLPFAQLLHCRLLKTSLTSHTLLSNRLIFLYSKLHSLPSALSAFHDLPFKNPHSFNTLLSSLASTNLPSALHLFDQMPHRNLVSYNTLLSSLSHHNLPSQSLRLFSQMRTHLPPPSFDRFTVVAVATACTALRDLNSLKQLHGAVISNGLELNNIMCNVFVDGYGKCGDVGSMRQVFDGMEERDVVSWTSLVAGYAHVGRLEEARRTFEWMPVRNAVSWTALVSGHEQNGEEEKAIGVFERMVDEGVCPTAFTLVSVLSSCARLGLVGKGKQVHGYVTRRRFDCVSSNVFLCNALIDMYSKCGDMGLASAVFDSMVERDLISWNSMVTGFAQNGLGLQSLAVFERMIEAGLQPNQVTFLGVLSACSHTGLVSEGRRFMKLMEKEFGLCPSSEHYAAFVDALGRNRRLEEAAELIESLPSSSVGTWGALLGACRVHGDLELGKRAAERLFALEPDNGARYVTLSNIYAAAGRWDEARRVRLVMKRKRLRKEAGCSWIEVRSVKHVFGSGDESHCQSEEVYAMLDLLVDQMKGE